MRHLVACVLLLAGGMAAQVAPTTIQRDALGMHDLSSGASPVSGALANACNYCHITHRAGAEGPLWNQTLSTSSYTLNPTGSDATSTQTSTGTTTTTSPITPPIVASASAIGKTSRLCLSCHDGTVAVGQTVSYGALQLSGSMRSLGTQLETSHPFSLKLPMQDSPDLVSSLVASQLTGDLTNSVHLVNGNIECDSCHNVHYQNVDPLSPKFLSLDNKSGKLCLACHGDEPRTLNSKENPLGQWLASAHAVSTAQVGLNAALGGYSTIAEFACQSCHTAHNSAGGGLVRQASTQIPNVDTASRSCLICHDGSDNMSQPIANVLAEVQKSGHLFADSSNPHALGEPVILDHNRHATCADCHQPHAARQTASFNLPPELRPAQAGMSGVAMDGTIVPGGATKQFETCLRCHGASQGKQTLPIFGYMPIRATSSTDPLNLIPEFSDSATSTHPVMRDRRGTSEPSLLASMWDITGKIATRPMGLRLYCTDCHNSDANREFGGTGPNGPHGSRNFHILERPYTESQVAPGTWPTGGPGTPIVNLSQNPPLDPAVPGPYTMCAKCHDLSIIMTNSSFLQHSGHITAGISCSVCHSAHGVAAGSPGTTGARLINFDLNVVAPLNGVVAYNTATCTLRCHMMDHNPDGSITPAPAL